MATHVVLEKRPLNRCSVVVAAAAAVVLLWFFVAMKPKATDCSDWPEMLATPEHCDYGHGLTSTSHLLDNKRHSHILYMLQKQAVHEIISSLIAQYV